MNRVTGRVFWANSAFWDLAETGASELDTADFLDAPITEFCQVVRRWAKTRSAARAPDVRDAWLALRRELLRLPAQARTTLIGDLPAPVLVAAMVNS